MGVLDDLATIGGRGDLTDDEKYRLIARRKADEVEGRLAVTLPATVGPITVTGVRRVEDRGSWAVEVEGSGGRIDWPVRVVNPPMLVPDASGTIVRDVVDGGRKIGERRFRLDPLAALRETLAGLR